MDADVQAKTEDLANEIATQAKTLEDLNGVLRSLMKSALERMLGTELRLHLDEESKGGGAGGGPSVAGEDAGDPPRRNRRNGRTPKSIQGEMGKLALAVPRDRNGTFEPQLLPKHQRRLSGFDEKILALYAKGMTTRDIQQIVKELYGVDVSPTLISEITSDLDAEAKAWQTRHLEKLYPILFLDGIVVHVRAESGQVGTPAELTGISSVWTAEVDWVAEGGAYHGAVRRHDF